MDQNDREYSQVWRVTRDDRGNAVLGWIPDAKSLSPRRESDTDETHSYLRRLDLSTLQLVDEVTDAESVGFNPYNTGVSGKNK